MFYSAYETYATSKEFDDYGLRSPLLVHLFVKYWEQLENGTAPSNYRITHNEWPDRTFVIIHGDWQEVFHMSGAYGNCKEGEYNNIEYATQPVEEPV